MINNRTVLISLIVIIGVIFTVLLNQANKSDFTNSFVIVPAPVVTRSILLPRIISTSTNPAITSTTTSVSKTSATQSSTTSTNRNYVINDNYVFTTDENPGVYSEAVANMQNRLIKTGYFNGVPGGFFGPATSAALKVYQKAKGLTETGILDAPTRAKLNVK